MSFKVVNALYIPGIDFGEDLLKPFTAEVVNGDWRSEEDIIHHARDADALICTGPLQPITSKVIQALTRCRIVSSNAIGYDRIDLEAATSRGIAVTNCPDYCLDEVSDHAIALMMALGRRLFRIEHAVRSDLKHIVPPGRAAVKEIAYPIFRMRDQTLGIIGLGRIGTASALKARGLGMRVIAYDPYVFKSVMTSRGILPVDFETLLRESDFIGIHALLNDETREMMGYAQFKQMKPTAYLINTARGGIVEEAGLIRALQDGLIAGAALDVLAVEPLRPDNPLRSMSNVILTGHSAWYSVTSDKDLWRKPMTQVVMALKGQWPSYAVNPDARKGWLERWAKAQ